jgi:hypothetical protein
MARVVALHEIIRAAQPGIKGTKDDPAGTPPQQEVIKAGTLFEVAGQELKDLQNNGSVCDPKDKQASKFGYGSEATKYPAFEAEEGETAESSATRQRLRSNTDRTARRSAARGGAATDATKDKSNRNNPDLVG